MNTEGRLRFKIMQDKYRKGNMRKIDYGIRAFVNDLNKHGYQTLFSCAGHKDSIHSNGKLVPDKNGYVVIRGRVNADEIKNIARRYVGNVIIRQVRMTATHGDAKTYSATSVSFKARNLEHWHGG
jgi:hypothetical protein